MRQLPRLCCLCLCILALACKGGGGTDGQGGGPGGNGGVDGGSGGVDGGGNGGVGGSSTTDCDPGSMRDCYTGPAGTETMGACTIGSETCNAEGTDWGACIGEVVPTPEVDTPPGQTPVDEDCDGMIDEAP
ncbi:MAG: hypothetical protein OES69_08440 [Myxococcales bacterium]|nr:hypothetical protein [Myxococcales bacterium]MDH3843952.1 hypothetical protein [Myxococcales bacterium]